MREALSWPVEKRQLKETWDNKGQDGDTEEGVSRGARKDNFAMEIKEVR